MEMREMLRNMPGELQEAYRLMMISRESGDKAAEERARAPVNFPKNYAFSKNGTHLYAHTVAGWHGTKPENATISGDKENFYNTIAQALTADNKPDPNGCGRVKLLDWIRKRRPDLLPVARLIMGTPSFIRLVKAEGALRLPSADGDDLDLSAADWDPLSLECPDYNDPNYAKTQVRLPRHLRGVSGRSRVVQAGQPFVEVVGVRVAPTLVQQ